MPDLIQPLVLGPGRVSDTHATAVLDGAGIAPAAVRVLDVAGPGAVECWQGILTNDVEAVGSDGFLYGAVLTPKGSIVCDLWTARHGGELTLFPPDEGAPALQEIMTRSLPPRLARASDRSGGQVVYRLVGPRALETAARAGIIVPERGRTAAGSLTGSAYLTARPPLDLPFVLQLLCAPQHAELLHRAVVGAGAVALEGFALDISRVLSGWPKLGAEIGERTLPQEVRLDEIDGVSFTKGCYTGQETVARLHFRGHTNWWLAGLEWERAPETTSAAIKRDRQTVGRVSSMIWLAPFQRYLGLGLVRRELTPGDTVVAGGAPAHLVDLPFRLE